MKQYYFNGRLNVSPQVRIETWTHTDGFTSLNEAIDFCQKNLFDYTIYHFENKKKIIDIQIN